MRNNDINKKSGYLFILPWCTGSIGGVNEVVLNLYDAIEKGGKYRPIILVNNWDSLRLERHRIDNREVVKLRLRSPYSSQKTILRILIYFLFLPHNLFVIAKLLKEQNIEVVNPHYPELSLYFFHLLKKIKIFRGKFIISLHGTDVRSLDGIAGVRKILWRSIFVGCHRIVACSHALKHEAMSILNIKDNKFKVIHNGVSDAFKNFGKVIDKFNYYNKLCSIKYILNVGSFEPNKRQDILIKSFHLIASEFPEYNLIIVGRKSGFLEELKQLVNELKLGGRVIFFADIPHCYIWQFFKFANFFVLTSRKESFPIVVLEASVFKLPVLATNVGGVSEIIQHGISGRLVRVDSIEDLRDEMKRFCLNDSDIKQLGENLHEQVYKKFTWENAYCQYIELCD